MLARWSGGDPDAFDRLVTLLYDELKRLAHARLRHEAGGTLDTTGLVHEAWLKLGSVEGIDWHDRNHFLSFAARVMRRILVDQARRRAAAKRGGGGAVTFDEAHMPVAPGRPIDVVALDDLLQRLEEEHPRPAKAVELHYFGGLSQDETAAVLGISQPTVTRDLRFALAWLGREWER